MAPTFYSTCKEKQARRVLILTLHAQDKPTTMSNGNEFFSDEEDYESDYSDSNASSVLLATEKDRALSDAVMTRNSEMVRTLI